MNELEQNAFLLHSRPYRDNKVIVEFLTQSLGKVSALAYVGNSVKSSKKALLQPFIPLQIVLKGQGGLKTLARIENANKSFLLTGDYLYSGFYLNELQVRLLAENIPLEALYEQYQKSLVLLSQQQAIESILRDFENALLNELGLTIDYSILFEQNHDYYHYLPEQGLVPAFSDGCVKLSAVHLKQIAQQQVNDKDVRQSYKLLMRQVFEPLLAGKPLNSRKLFKRN